MIRFFPSKLTDQLRILARKKIGFWLERRIPPSEKVILDHRRIFIFPTFNGLMFLGVSAILFLAGINYQNNLMLALSFLLVSLFITSIFSTYGNLSGLRLENAGSLPVFAGESACFCVKVTGTSGATGQNLQFQVPGQESVTASLNPEGQLLVSLPFETEKRGWCKPGRFHLQTYYPLGLIRSWSWVDLQLSCLVYPKPVYSPKQNDTSLGQGRQESGQKEGVEDFSELRNYRLGDSPKHINWKLVAKGSGLYTKSYQGYSGSSQWVDWLHWPSIQQEQKLSAMTYCILVHEKKQEAFGLRLPNVEVLPGFGESHVLNALKAVALFGQNENILGR